jgi:hypothetical protein
MYVCATYEEVINLISNDWKGMTFGESQNLQKMFLVVDGAAGIAWII